jgi:hypothetical protein
MITGCSSQALARQEPANLGPNVNTPAPEGDAFYFVDPTSGQSRLYFTGFNRPDGIWRLGHFSEHPEDD